MGLPWPLSKIFGKDDHNQVEGKPRFIYPNDPAKNATQMFAPNVIQTGRVSIHSGFFLHVCSHQQRIYTPLTFLPKNLFEQFMRVANTYFLIIATLQLIPGLSPISPITSVVPLVGVLTVTAVKEALEDYRRHKMDGEINGRLVRVVRGGSSQDITWADLCVGDVVKVTSGQHFPADLILLASSEPQGICYIETANLDGETNLKIRESLAETNTMKNERDVLALRGAVECEAPNNRLYTFSGKLMLNGKTLALGPKQICLRGCCLRNSQWIYGLVIFTGHETKLMKNSTETPSKRSSMEKEMNVEIIRIFSLLLLTCAIAAIAAGVWFAGNGSGMWYLSPSRLGSPGDIGGQSFITFIILLNSMVPISLYVSMEMVKLFHALLINSDQEMYYDIADTPALARTSSLSEELGEISYIFSDKTGTLTRNVMEFRKCSVGGVSFGTGTTEIGRAAAKRLGKVLEDETKPNNLVFEKGFNMWDPRLLSGAWRKEANASQIRDFYIFLAVCHTVIPEKDKEHPDKLIYQAASPDEGALVAGAQGMGFVFHTRTPHSVIIRIDGEGDFEYEILNVLEFNSTRKRMSVITRCPDGRIMLMCKGADTMIYQRLKPSSPFKQSTLEHLTTFADEGLRTLCIAQCQIPAYEYDKWAKIYFEASIAMEKRDDKLDAAAELIEKDLELIGATAIEDKLQEGVPDCIATLAQANIKIWVLTGDKQETAINIGFACALLHNDMDLIVISVQDAQDKTQDVVREETRNQLMQAIDTYGTREGGGAGGNEKGLVIDGTCLLYALEEDLKMHFLRLGQSCKAVVCCRVSPLQKALVVSLVKDNVPGIVTLAIGDGANDVSMIQAAHVGVGISGQEGMQAVMSSDYAIAQFKYLSRLLLVHGRWDYQRIAVLIVYSFYKNILFAFTQFWYAIFSGFSGATLHDSWTISFYNLFFTALPIVFLSIFDQDAGDMKAVMEFPRLYVNGQRKRAFNFRVFAQWIAEALYGSVIVFFFSLASVGDGALPGGVKATGISVLGTTVYTAILLTVTLRVAIEIKYWTWLNHLSVWGSMVAWFIFCIIYGSFPPDIIVKSGSSPNMFNVANILFSEPAFWFNTILCPMVALGPIFLWKLYNRVNAPTASQVVQEWVLAGRPDDEMENKAKMASDRVSPFDKPDEPPKVSVCELATRVAYASSNAARNGAQMLRRQRFAQIVHEGAVELHTGFAFSGAAGQLPQGQFSMMQPGQ